MVSAGTGLVVREIIPCRTVGAIVLSNRSPLTLAQIRPPFLPRGESLRGLVQPFVFRLICAGHDAPSFLPVLKRFSLPQCLTISYDRDLEHQRRFTVHFSSTVTLCNCPVNGNGGVY